MIKSKYGSFLLLCIAMLLPAYAAAQDDEGPAYLSVRRVTTHTSGIDTWEAQQVKMAEARKEAGSGARHVWQQVVGDLETYHIVTFQAAIGGGGGGGGGQNQPLGDSQDEWLNTTGPTIEARHSSILQRYPDLSIPGGEDNEFILLRYTTLAPGNNNAYENWLRDKLVPALKAGGAKGVNYNRVRLGGDTNMWVSSVRIASLADLNNPGPLAGLSSDERAELFAGLGDMVWESELRVLRYRADMSNDAPEAD